MSASATGSTPATRRATRELQSLEKVGAWLSKLPQLGRGAAMSRTLLPRGALSAYSAAVDHVLRVDESTCQPEGAVIGSDHGRSPIPGGLGASVRAASPYHDSRVVRAGAEFTPAPLVSLALGFLPLLSFLGSSCQPPRR